MEKLLNGKPEKTGNIQTKKDTKFKKGQSGNPAGKPKGAVSITTAIKQELLKIPPEQKKTWLALTVKRILQKAIAEGDTQMIKTLWNYVDGMPKQDVKVDLNEVKFLININDNKRN